MRFLELELENWGCHKNARIDLSGGLQIEGRNGTGKSSILEAIRFILSKSGKGYASKITHGATFSRVKLRFTQENDVYSIEKRIYPKSSRKTASAVMWINREPVADNATSVYNHTKDIIPEDLFDRLVYVPQGSVTEIITNLRRKGGRQEFDELFNLQRLEKVYKGVSGEIRDKEAEYRVISQQLGKYSEDAGKIFDRETARLESAVKEAERRLADLSRERKITDSKIEQLEKKIGESRKTLAEKEGLEKALSDLKVRRAETVKSIESLRETISRGAEKEREAEKLRGRLKDLGRYIDIEGLLTEIAAGEDKLRKYRDLPDKRKDHESVEAELNRRYGLEVEYETAKTRINKIREIAAARRHAISEGRKHLSEISSISGKAKCPKCGQKLTQEHVEAEKKRITGELSSLDSELREVSGELVSLEKRAEAIKKDLEGLKEKEYMNRRRKEEIERGEAEEEEIRSGIAGTRKQLEGLDYSGESIDLVKGKIKELREAEATVRVYGKDIEGLEKKSGELREAEVRLVDLDSEKERLETAIGQLKYDASFTEELRKKKDALLEERAKRSVEAERLALQSGSDKKEIGELKGKKAEFLELSDKEEKARTEIALLKEARDIFHTDRGVVKYLREKYIRQLSILLTENFRRINQNPEYRDVAFNKDYEIEIRSARGALDLDMLSGGEKVQIAIALRMALMELLSPMRMLILDEPFGSLDADHREALGEALNRIAAEGQLIIVTHIPVNSLQLPELDLGSY